MLAGVAALLALGGMAQAVLEGCGAADSSVDVRRLPEVEVALVPGTLPYNRRGRLK